MARPEHLPLELLQTFVRIAELDGDATSAAHELAISQPTISKRLSALRRLTNEANRQPWLLLKGKCWKVTPEGQRVRGVVADLVRRYEEMEQFVAGTQSARQLVSLACGQQAATGFVKQAIEKFVAEHPACHIRLSSPRGKARIEGVAGGQFDLALVTDSPTAIHRIARMELYIQTLFEDRFVLVANPPFNAAWGEQWHALATDRPVAAKQLLGLPFILPEPDAARRQQFDEWTHRATGKLFDVVFETGGWQTIVKFAQAGLGIGLVPQTSLESLDSTQKDTFTTRQVSVKDFPPDAVRLIARKAHGAEAPALSEMARRLATLMQDFASA